MPYVMPPDGNGDIMVHTSPPIPPPPVVPLTSPEEGYHQKVEVASAQAKSHALGNVDRFDNVLIRGGSLTKHAEDRVQDVSVSMSSSEVSEITINLSDPNFDLLRSKVFAGYPTLAYQGLSMIVADVATKSDGGLPGLSLKARSRAIEKLKAIRGPFVMRSPGTSAAGFVATECQKAGVPVVVESTPVVAQVSRDVAPFVQPTTLVAPDEIPSAWTTIKRLAEEYGYLCFEAANVLYFCSPSYLFKNARVARVHYGELPKTLPAPSTKKTMGVVVDPLTGRQKLETIVSTGPFESRMFRVDEPPVCDHSKDSYSTTVSVELLADAEGWILPGYVLELTGVPHFSGLYLVDSVTYSLTSPTMTVTASTPIDTPPQNPGGILRGVGAAGDVSLGYDASASTSSGRGLPVCGITTKKFMAGLRKTESGDYNEHSNPGYATGAYQIEGPKGGDTWRAWAGAAIIDQYGPEAYMAPKQVQDAVVRNVVTQRLRTYNGDWGKVAASWYWPALADKPSRWDFVPPNNRLSINEYVLQVLQNSNGNPCDETPQSDTKLATDFVSVALAQVGKRYVRGAFAPIDDPSPDAFDCSELVQWAAGRVGVTVPRTSWEQWNAAKKRGTTLSVAAALKIRGALLFVDGDGNGEGGAHVAISMGNGTDLAAHDPQMGISVVSTSAGAWDRAAYIPGMTYYTPAHRLDQ